MQLGRLLGPQFRLLFLCPVHGAPSPFLEGLAMECELGDSLQEVNRSYL